jgi:hypothetical protein
MLLVYTPHVCRYNHQIRHKKLSIKLLKNQISSFLGEKIHCSNLFCVFLKTSFSWKAFDCATYNPSLILSDRAEIFTTNTLKYSPEVKSAVLIFDQPIRIYRVFKPTNPGFWKTFPYFFNQNKESKTFEKAQFYLWDIVVGISRKIFSPIGQI